MINDFNAFRTDMQNALAQIEQKYNGVFSIGKIGYNSDSANIKITFLDNVIEGDNSEQKLFNQMCEDYGFTKEDYNKSLTLDGKVFKFVGFNPKARKNYCQIKKDSSIYVCTIEAVRQGMKNFIK